MCSVVELCVALFGFVVQCVVKLSCVKYSLPILKGENETEVKENVL